MENGTLLTDDGRIVRVDKGYWSYYINGDRATELLDYKCGKWMFYFGDIAFVESVCRKAVLEGAVAECKHTAAEVFDGSGVGCFYLNVDDIVAHHRVLAFMLANGLIRKKKNGTLFNIGFKLDSQTMAGEYGSEFKAEVKLEDFVNLETGEFL